MLVAAGGENYKITPALFAVFTKGWPLVGILCGVLFWKELREADGRIKVMFAIMLLLLASGLGLAAMAFAVQTKVA
jgi:hypothetical protein